MRDTIIDGSENEKQKQHDLNGKFVLDCEDYPETYRWLKKIFKVEVI